MLNLDVRIKGGLWGLLVGDALGVPYEFHSPDELEGLSIEMNPPSNFDRAHDGTPVGTWSDDGAQALCLLDSLLTCGSFNLKHFSNLLISWYENGLWAVDGRVYDIGIQTSQALRAYKKGTSPYSSGFVRPDGKGNGALMRVLPLALWHQGDDEELVEFAHNQSLITHGHPCNQVCSALYCLWARGLLNGISNSEAYTEAVKTLKQLYQELPSHLESLQLNLRPFDYLEGTGTGYVIDSIRSSYMLLERHDNYHDVVIGAIKLGHDTDTTAAIAGGLAGVREGLSAIPAKWLKQLRAKEQVEPLLETLLKLHGLS